MKAPNKVGGVGGRVEEGDGDKTYRNEGRDDWEPRPHLARGEWASLLTVDDIFVSIFKIVKLCFLKKKK